MEAALVPASPDRSYRRAMTSTHTTRLVDFPAALGTLGALGFTAVGVLQAIDPTFPGEAAFAGRNSPSAIAALLKVGSVVALHRSGAAGTRRFVRIGLAAAALGWVVDAAAQLISQAMGFDYPPRSTWPPPPRSSPRPVRSPTSPEPSGACAGSR